jgi:hypothetical protein
MGWWDTYRERNSASRARIAEHPVAAWVVHSITFTAFAFVLQRLRGGEVDWISPLILGTAVAAGLVIGTVAGHRRQQRRSQKQ